jgi:hypothetical protein
MSKNKNLFPIFLITILSFFFLAFRPADLENTNKVTDNAYSYLVNTTNGATLDTVASATANDTGYIYLNPYFYDDIYCEYIQNSVRTVVKLAYPKLNNIRVRYLAADSSFHFEHLCDFGWVTIPVIPIGATNGVTTASIITATLRTGTFIYEFRATMK